MTAVHELIPGCKITLPGPDGDLSATFVAQTRHPIWPNLCLVIWRLADGSWSHDALDPRQQVGEMLPSDVFSRMANLRAALLGGG